MIYDSFVVGHDEFDIYSGVDFDGGDFLDIWRGAYEIDNSFEYFHFELIPSFASLTDRRPSGGHVQSFGGKSDRSHYLNIFFAFGFVYNLAANSFHVLHVSASQSYSHVVLLYFLLPLCLFFIYFSHIRYSNKMIYIYNIHII